MSETNKWKKQGVVLKLYSNALSRLSRTETICDIDPTDTGVLEFFTVIAPSEDVAVSYSIASMR